MDEIADGITDEITHGLKLYRRKGGGQGGGQGGAAAVPDSAFPDWAYQRARVGMPRWEYGGTFERAYMGANTLLLWSGSDTIRETAAWTLSLLRVAHVATIDLDQYDALPDDVDELLDFEPDPHLPFPVLYVSVGDPTGHLAGFLIAATESEDDEREERLELSLVPFFDIGKPRIALPTAVSEAKAGRYMDLLAHYFGDEFREDDRVASLRLLFKCLKVVRFMESANVDLGPTPVSRQVRRRAVRKNTPIALRVHVRGPRAKRVPLVTHGGAVMIERTHRWEVAGNYAHYGPDTMIFKATKRDRPEKIIHHPTRGPVVRIWRQDHVKGPEDKPLVPKARVYHRREAVAKPVDP